MLVYTASQYVSLHINDKYGGSGTVQREREREREKGHIMVSPDPDEEKREIER